jgi:hypothetical protein
MPQAVRCVDPCTLEWVNGVRVLVRSIRVVPPVVPEGEVEVRSGRGVVVKYRGFAAR